MVGSTTAVPYSLGLLGWGGVGTGIVLAIWARTILGRNWSGVAVVKAGHDLITGVPYQIVRHWIRRRNRISWSESR